MSNNDAFTLDAFLSSNPKKNLNSIDYIHAVFELNELPIDFVFCVMRLISPDIKIVDGLIFLEEQFDMDRYTKHLSEGRNKKECQKWINLIELTGLFCDVEIEKILQLAHFIVSKWNFKFANERLDGIGSARVIFDDKMNEVFITID